MRNTKSLCEQAKLHYHDLLCGQDSEIVPDDIINHVEQCWYCRNQIDELRRALTPAVKRGKSEPMDAAALTDMLRLHLAYVGKEVTCEIVRPFLPGMVIPSLEIKVPTPITVHLDKCQQCVDDLETLRNLNLTRQQLCRLSEFFAETPYSCSSVSDEKQKAARQVAGLDWKKTSAETLRHLCKCSVCRDLVYMHRQEIMDNLTSEKQSREITCEAILPSGFFDYVFPYGIDPANDQYAKFRETFVSHAIKCPDCLSRMQQLHNRLYEIEQQPNSEVITVFSQETDAESELLEKCDSPYEGYPIRVDTVSESQDSPRITPQETRVVNFADAVRGEHVESAKKKSSRRHLSYELKAGVAAAALIIIGLTLFFHKPVTAELTPLDKMHNAMQKVSNIHTMQFVPGKEAPISEQWVSRSAGIFLIKDNRETILYDISKKIGKSKLPGGNPVETWPLSKEDAAYIKNANQRFLDANRRYGFICELDAEC